MCSHDRGQGTLRSNEPVTCEWTWPRSVLPKIKSMVFQTLVFNEQTSVMSIDGRFLFYPPAPACLINLT